ncbi:D-2-hydroxyacid dehydrogenase [Buttiauxella warmboldiae]|uniref:D-2-hydroxyacid dehydrogenase n=1 Tax=Buttiauxella warmboldiae TaxID=82993 RepID=A0A3N5E521_9ENTR|nr:D-2-hydroxyacid dehydrogenase [Buttiauxella warmboldiae]RPH30169.1 D-2-hydroxyacid dehydrogenase [Buttiauxella warmboldiae]
MKIVTLDGDTLPQPLNKPCWCKEWDYRGSTSKNEVAAALNKAEIVITNKVELRENLLRDLPELRFICVAATGFDCIDIEYCRRRGIVVSNVPGYSANSVAEGVIAFIFALRRHLKDYLHAANDEWPDSQHFCLHHAPISDVRDATLGIVGRGDIGSHVARLAKAIGMNVVFAEHKGAHDIRSGYAPFEEVISRSDIITLHCPLSESTREMIDMAALKQMKPGALLINTARGLLINEADLANALRTGIISGAALDVLATEPPAASHPLLDPTLKNLLVTPHIAWASHSGVTNLIKAVEYNLTGYYSGQIKNRVV